MKTTKKGQARASIAVRISDEERQIIRKNAEECGYGNNISAYMRQCSLAQTGIQVVHKDREIMELLYMMDSKLKKLEQVSSNLDFDMIREEMSNICASLKL